MTERGVRREFAALRVFSGSKHEQGRNNKWLEGVGRRWYSSNKIPPPLLVIKVQYKLIANERTLEEFEPIRRPISDITAHDPLYRPHGRVELNA